MKFQLFACVMIACAAAASAQVGGEGEDEKSKKPKWDVAAPPLPMRQVNIDVDE